MKREQMEWSRFDAYGYKSLIAEGYTGKTKRILVLEDKNKTHVDKVVTRHPYLTPNVPFDVFPMTSSSTQEITRGIKQAIVKGYSIASVSYSSARPDHALKKIIANAYKNNVLVVCSSGNNGNELKRFPSAYEETISIGAIDNDTDYSEWATRGESIDFVGWGQNIPYEHSKDNWQYCTGTSPTTFDIACLIAMIWEKLDKKHGSEQSIDILKAHLKTMTIDLGNKEKDIQYGYGFLTANFDVFYAVYCKMNNFDGVKLSERVQRIKNGENEAEVNKDYGVLYMKKIKTTTGKTVEIPVFSLKKVK